MTDDRRLGRELRRLGEADWQPPVGGAAAAVRSARRRTGATVAGLAAAVAAVALAVPVALGGGTTAAPLPPSSAEPTQQAGPSQAPSEVPAPLPVEPSPGATAPVEQGPPDASPAPVVEPVVSPLVVVDGGDQPTRAGTLAGLRVTALEPGAADDGGSGAEPGSGGTSWGHDPCGDGTAAADELRTGWYSAVAPGLGDTVPTFEAATYPDEATATAALAGLLAEVERCAQRDGTVWHVWDGSAADGAARLVSYDLRPAGDVGNGFGTRVRLGVAGSSLVVVGAAGRWLGTENAVALGDTRPEVGPIEMGTPPGAVDRALEEYDTRWAALRDDVVAHLEGRAPVAPEPTGSFPEQASAAQGETFVAVVVAVVRDGDDPRVAQAVADLAAVGYEAGVGDAGCTQGVHEGLGLDPAVSYTTVDVLFRTREEAQQFVDAFVPGVVGTVQVQTYCVD